MMHDWTLQRLASCDMGWLEISNAWMHGFIMNATWLIIVGIYQEVEGFVPPRLVFFLLFLTFACRRKESLYMC